MVIELQPATEEGKNPKLIVEKLVVGDYIIFSFEKMLTKCKDKIWEGKNIEGSYMCKHKVYEYSYFDASKRGVVDKKYPDGLEVVRFEPTDRFPKIEKIGVSKLIKLQAVETKNGKIAYDIKEYVDNSTTSSDGEIIDVHFKNDGTTITDIEKLSILKAINSFKESNFTDEQIIQFLSPKCPVESLKELMQLK